MTIKNKLMVDEKIISTYQAKLTTLTSEDVDVVDELCFLFGSLKRKWTSYSNHENGNRTLFVNHFREEDGKPSFSYRFFQGVVADVKGLTKSIISNKKNYILDKKTSLSKKKKFATKKINTYKKLKKKTTKIQTMEDVSNLLIARKAMQKACSNRDKVKSSIDKLSNQLKSNKTSICYGTNTLLKKRSKMKKEIDIKSWKEEWSLKRNNSVFFVGSSDEVQGCSTAQLYFNEATNLFDLHLAIPPIIQNKMKKTGEKPRKKLIINDIKMPKNGFEDIKEQILAFKEKESVKQSFSFRLLKNETGCYTLNVSTKKIIKAPISSDYNGVVGMDLNPDNLSVADIDRHGNLLKSFIIDMKLKGKTSEQSESIIGNAVKKLMDYVEETGKSLIIEDLDFRKKKRDLVDNFNSKYAAMLSSFAYVAVTNNILRQGIKRKIDVVKVNPAYTSLIGKVKYQVKKGVSIHESAAYVIARRHYDFKEKINKKIYIKIKSNKYIERKEKVYTLFVPEVIRADLRAFSRWLGSVFGNKNTIFTDYHSNEIIDIGLFENSRIV